MTTATRTYIPATVRPDPPQERTEPMAHLHNLGITISVGDLDPMQIKNHRQLMVALSLLTEDEKREVVQGCYESSADGKRMVDEEWSLDDVLGNEPELVGDALEALYPVAVELAAD